MYRLILKLCSHRVILHVISALFCLFSTFLQK